MCNTKDKAHYALFFTRGPSKRGKLTKNPFLPGRGGGVGCNDHNNKEKKINKIRNENCGDDLS